MVVIRYEGPRGAPGMPEMLDPTSRITALCRRRGITIALMTDARFSGGSVGLVIGHVSPEAALGGPIALIEDGDTIVVDVNDDTLDCAELETRRRSRRGRRGGRPKPSATAVPTRWSGPPTPGYCGGCAPARYPRSKAPGCRRPDVRRFSRRISRYRGKVSVTAGDFLPDEMRGSSMLVLTEAAAEVVKAISSTPQAPEGSGLRIVSPRNPRPGSAAGHGRAGT